MRGKGEGVVDDGLRLSRDPGPFINFRSSDLQEKLTVAIRGIHWGWSEVDQLWQIALRIRLIHLDDGVEEMGLLFRAFGLPLVASDGHGEGKVGRLRIPPSASTEKVFRTPISSRTRKSSSCHVFPFENDRLLFRFALWITTLPSFVTVAPPSAPFAAGRESQPTRQHEVSRLRPSLLRLLVILVHLEIGDDGGDDVLPSLIGGGGRASMLRRHDGGRGSPGDSILFRRHGQSLSRSLAELREAAQQNATPRPRHVSPTSPPLLAKRYKRFCRPHMQMNLASRPSSSRRPFSNYGESRFTLDMAS